MSFRQLIRSHKNLSRIGLKIIDNHKLLNRIPPKNIDQLYEKQHDLINEYCELESEHKKLSKKTNYLINEYWTGLD
jgi:hypothetical protein